ncbi:HNH endonuclease [Nitratireductor sp. B36]|uniref:HNH endonuclease n=1 Tax=Nitratireductor sp. B36 TaxID=2762059 RepID=UPI001E29A3D1|nr:HNH endonuclease [Nitratireductor sp. B36]MCC5777876.1 HNH endonuclease [Nitratireductor sp. B36]
MTWGYEAGRVYNRTNDIHGRFKGEGSRQSGIITFATHPVVVIISGKTGIAHGYADRWRTDGAFEYFGAGQIGDMVMLRGNRAIADHSADGKSLLLFFDTGNGLRFHGEMVCEGYHIERAPDQNGDKRDAIVFELRDLEAVAIKAVDADLPTDVSLDELRKRALAAVETPTSTSESKARTVYQRSRDVRAYVLARANGVCEGCEKEAPFIRVDGTPYLEPHHLRRISDGGPDDPRFVIGICPNCHRQVHHGIDGVEYNTALLKKMKSIEPTT